MMSCKFCTISDWRAVLSLRKRVIRIKALTAGLILLGILWSSEVSLAQLPAKIVSGSVRDSQEQKPTASLFFFTAYIVGRPGETLTKTDNNCGYSDGTWWVDVSTIYNSKGGTAWQAGDVLHVDFEYNAPGGKETGSVEETLEEGSAPQTADDVTLPVELSLFEAYSTEGAITLRWITQSEVDNLGFNLYRSTERAGEYVRINGQLIEGAGSSASAHSYEYTDHVLSDSAIHWYKLEDVDFSGKKTVHPPISVTLGDPSKESSWGKIKARF